MNTPHLPQNLSELLNVKVNRNSAVWITDIYQNKEMTQIWSKVSILRPKVMMIRPMQEHEVSLLAKTTGKHKKIRQKH